MSEEEACARFFLSLRSVSCCYRNLGVKAIKIDKQREEDFDRTRLDIIAD